MMTNPKILADAQLPNVKTTAYTVPAGFAAIISSICLVNVTGGAITVNVYVSKGTSRSVIPLNNSIAAGAAYYVTIPFALAAGELIEWDASAATSIDGVIFGSELMSQ